MSCFALKCPICPISFGFFCSYNWKSQLSFCSLWLPDLISPWVWETRRGKGLLSESLLLCLRLLHRQLSLRSQKTTTQTLCLYVHEGKPVAILRDQKLFLMGNIESAGLKTQLCDSDGNIISAVSQCSLRAQCARAFSMPGSRETARRRSDVFLNNVVCLLTPLGI